MSDLNLLNYKASPTGAAFHLDNSFVRGIMGPFGSGKSVACVWEIFMRAKSQAPGKDGIRKSRWIVSRNTQPELENTTIKTWLDWFPEHIFGKMSRKPPFTHKVKINDMELEVIFLALDKADDVKKLLSFEVTGIFFNEAREMDYEIISGATGRVGRYPSKKDKPDSVPDHKWPTWSGIIMDTNPPDDSHWWYKSAEEDSWAYDDDRRLLAEFRRYTTVENIPSKFRWRFWKQPSGLSDKAENVENLPGGYDYYHKQIAGKTKEFVNVYVHGNYGTIVHGQPVYGSAYNESVHKADHELSAIPIGMIYMGIDSSGRYPSTVFAQRVYPGQIQVIEEFCVLGDEGMGAENYARYLKAFMNEKFPGRDFDIWGDPAGGWGQNLDERTYFDVLRAQGIHCKPSPGLRFAPRKEAVLSLLNRNIEGKPALLVSPKCKMLTRGFEGGYRYKKLNVSGGIRYAEKPDKSVRFADVHDAFQYMVTGMGELDNLFGRKRSVQKTVIANSDFSF